MISLFLVAILSVFSDKEAQKPISVEVSGTVEAVKAELMRSQLDNGYVLCGETPSRLTFCEEPKKPKLPYIDRRERSFTIVPNGPSVKVIASEITARLTIGARFETPRKDKATRDELQKVLDKLKLTVEAILLPAQPFKAFFIVRLSFP